MKNLSAAALHGVRIYNIGGFFLLHQNTLDRNARLFDHQVTRGLYNGNDQVKAAALKPPTPIYA